MPITQNSVLLKLCSYKTRINFNQNCIKRHLKLEAMHIEYKLSTSSWRYYKLHRLTFWRIHPTDKMRFLPTNKSSFTRPNKRRRLVGPENISRNLNTNCTQCYIIPVEWASISLSRAGRKQECEKSSAKRRANKWKWLIYIPLSFSSSVFKLPPSTTPADASRRWQGRLQPPCRGTCVGPLVNWGDSHKFSVKAVQSFLYTLLKKKIGEEFFGTFWFIL